VSPFWLGTRDRPWAVSTTRSWRYSAGCWTSHFEMYAFCSYVFFFRGGRWTLCYLPFRCKSEFSLLSSRQQPILFLCKRYSFWWYLTPNSGFFLHKMAEVSANSGSRICRYVTAVLHLRRGCRTVATVVVSTHCNACALCEVNVEDAFLNTGASCGLR
jgi:hypothetical protein